MSSTVGTIDIGPTVRKPRRRQRRRHGASRVGSSALTGTDESVEDAGTDIEAREIVPKVAKQPDLNYNRFAALKIENALSTAALKEQVLAPPQTSFTFACSKPSPSLSSTSIATTPKNSDQAPLPSSFPDKPRRADYSCKEWITKPTSSILIPTRQTCGSAVQKGASVAASQRLLMPKPKSDLVKTHLELLPTKLSPPLSILLLSADPDNPSRGWPEVTCEPLAPLTKDRKSRFYPDSSNGIMNAPKETNNSRSSKCEKHRPPALALDLAFAVGGQKGRYIPVTPLSSTSKKEFAQRAKSHGFSNPSIPSVQDGSSKDVMALEDKAEQIKTVADACGTGECGSSTKAFSSGSEWEGKDYDYWR